MEGVFSKGLVLKNLAKFIENHLCQLLFFSNVADYGPASFIKKRNSFFIDHLRTAASEIIEKRIFNIKHKNE